MDNASWYKTKSTPEATVPILLMIQRNCIIEKQTGRIAAERHTHNEKQGYKTDKSASGAEQG